MNTVRVGHMQSTTIIAFYQNSEGGIKLAQITITTTQEEQDAVLEALRTMQGEVAPVSKIATTAKLSQSRVRYAIADLLESGKIKREPVKAFNRHYIRYKYEVVE